MPSDGSGTWSVDSRERQNGADDRGRDGSSSGPTWPVSPRPGCLRHPGLFLAARVRPGRSQRTGEAQPRGGSVRFAEMHCDPGLLLRSYRNTTPGTLTPKDDER
jgi:hypothetical protein